MQVLSCRVWGSGLGVVQGSKLDRVDLNASKDLKPIPCHAVLFIEILLDSLDMVFSMNSRPPNSCYYGNFKNRSYFGQPRYVPPNISGSE